jgi:uncharacterized NAD-dependent epimerase/dehydratase family protein
VSAARDGRAIVYCEGAFGTTNGKTAHGLVRRTERYELLSVIDSRHSGRDAGEVLDGRSRGIPVVSDLEQARRLSSGATHFVIGLAPDGGRLPASARDAVLDALRHGLHVDSGLHDFLGDDPEIAALAAARQLRVRDVRRPPERSTLHFFSGRIEKIPAPRIAVLGTDSAVGKRTTAWLLVDALRAAGRTAEMIGTGQTAWMQGVRYGVILDSLINDFLSGEIEHQICRCWDELRPDAIILEGQGSLMNPAYPGGYELLAAGRPAAIVLQHAPSRRFYDGFPDYPLHPLELQIRALELVSGRPVAAIAINHEGLDREQTRRACAEIARSTGRPAVDPLWDGAERLVDALTSCLGRG